MSKLTSVGQKGIFVETSRMTTSRTAFHEVAGMLFVFVFIRLALSPDL